MRTVKLGIVGLGVGAWHLESFQGTPGAEVIALCDADPVRLKSVGQAGRVGRLYASVQEMLRDPDVEAVSICVPNNVHADLAVAFLEAGRHVLCEKPLAATLPDGRRMVRAARASGKTSMLAMKFRFAPEAHIISRELARGVLGDVYYGCSHYLRPPDGIPKGAGNWFIRKEKAGGGALIDNGVHLLDLTWYLMGCPRPVSAYGATYARFGPRVEEISRHFDVEDFGCGMVRFENGASAYLDNAWAAMVADTVIGLRVAGTAGGATMWPFTLIASHGGRTAASTPAIDPSEYQTQFAHFIECITAGREPLSPFSQGLEVLKMLDAIYVSARTGKAEPVRREIA